MHLRDLSSDIPALRPTSRRLRPLLWGLFLLASIAATDRALAQFSDGAVIVTVPSDNKSETATPALKPPPKRQKTVKPKPKPRAAAKRSRRPVRRRVRNAAADRLRIAVLVNDDPITE